MRNLSPEMVDEVTSKYLKPALLAELQFDSATLYMWSGVGNLEYNGQSYLGGGNLVSVSPIQETQKLEAKGLVCTLNGIPSALVSAALSEQTRGRPFRLYFATVQTSAYVATEDSPGTVMTEDGGRLELENDLVDAPYRIFTGLMDVMEFNDDGRTAYIRLSVESAMIIGQRAKVRRYTPEDQKKLYPADQGLDMINRLQDKEVVW